MQLYFIASPNAELFCHIQFVTNRNRTITVNP